jgi:hypothetical protein
MIVVEGPDLVGKSTLCRALLRALYELNAPAVIRPFTRLPKCWRYPQDYLPHYHRFGVFDRFFPSEWAYSIARGEAADARLTHDAFRQLDARLTLVGGVRVLVTAEPALIRQTFERRGDDMYPLDVVLQANEAFLQPWSVEWADERYHRDREDGWPSDPGFVRRVVDLWQERQAALQWEEIVSSGSRLVGVA